MAKIITTSTYRYYDTQTRIINSVSYDEAKGKQTLNIISTGMKETFMDYWFFDYGGYHGSNPNGLGETDTPYNIMVDFTTTDVFNFWKGDGSPLIKTNSVTCDNRVDDIVPKYIDAVVTLKPIIWKDTYGKVGERIVFNIVNLPYYRDNPLYLEYATAPDFVGNKRVIPNAYGFLVEYYRNLFGLTTNKVFNYTVNNEYAVNAGTDTPEHMTQTATSKRIRNKITLAGGTPTEDVTTFFGIMYGVMPISIVINAHN